MKRLFLILALITGTASASTNFYALATIAETNIFLGQVFNLDVVVKADSKLDVPEINLPDFNATTLIEAQATSETNAWFYRFALRAKKDGALLIPALRFGTAYTQPISITAHKPEQTDRMTLEQRVNTNALYVGQPILLTTLWDSTYQFGAIKAVDFHFPILNDGRFQILDRYEPEKENAAKATGLPVHGTRVLATRNSYEIEEVRHQTLQFSKILIPQKSGSLSIPPATLLCAAEKEVRVTNKTRRSAFQYPAYFNNTFFDQNVAGDQWMRIFTESQPIELEIKPLPTADRPDLFNGMVGQYSIDVIAEPTDVRVGDPITLTIKITATDFMENIFFEPLRYQPNLVNRFEIPSDRSLPEREGKTKTYTQTIRALSTNNHEIPPILLAFFNPVQQRYETIESAPIPIRVTPADPIGVFGGAAYQNRLRSVDDGIRHNYENPDMLKPQHRPLFGWAHPITVLLLLLVPPGVFGFLSLRTLLGEKKHHIQRTAKAARAFKNFKINAHPIHRHSMKSAIYTDLDEVLRAYLGDRLHLAPGVLSYRNAESRLIDGGADPQTLDELKALFALCESYRFTAQFDEPGEARSIIHNAMRIVKQVERKLK